MTDHRWTAIVTILALLTYFRMSLQVARARGKAGIAVPAMTGEPIFERAVRVHINTLEWLPIFLTGLWLFAIYWNEMVAAGLGVVWIVGTADLFRRLHGRSRQAQHGVPDPVPGQRILLFGALGKIVYSLAVGGVRTTRASMGERYGRRDQPQRHHQTSTRAAGCDVQRVAGLDVEGVGPRRSTLRTRSLRQRGGAAIRSAIWREARRRSAACASVARTR